MRSADVVVQKPAGQIVPAFAPQPAYFGGIQDLRALAAIAVVLYHTHVLFQKEKYFGVEIAAGFFQFGHRGVELFFVISGFLMAMLSASTGKNAISSPGKFLIARIRRVFIPFLPLFFALSSVCIFAKSTCPAAYSFDIQTILLNFFMLPRANMDTYVPVVAWTLSHELFFYVMTCIALAFGGAGRLILGVWLAVSALFAVFDSTLAFPWVFLFSSYNLAFGLGMLAFWVIQRPLFGRFSVSARWLGAVSFVLLGCVEVFSVRATHQSNAFALTAGFFIASFFLVTGFSQASTAGLKRLGDASYSIYLIHYPLLVVLCLLAKRVVVFPVNILALYVTFGAFVVAAVVAGLVYYRFIERPALRLFGWKSIA